ncbi:hypothetical protein ACOSP7_013029 [Xanthoceras sorbifolium]
MRYLMKACGLKLKVKQFCHQKKGGELVDLDFQDEEVLVNQLGSRGLWDLDVANANKSVITIERATHMRLEGKERDQDMELQQRHQLLLAVHQLLLAL